MVVARRVGSGGLRKSVHYGRVVQVLMKKSQVTLARKFSVAEFLVPQ